MGAITTKSYVWSSTGVEPTKGDEVYNAGDQPVAEYDNWAMYSITDDIQSLNDVLGNHNQRHEADGLDEINLVNMDIGTTVSLAEPMVGVFDIQDMNGVAKASLDVDQDYWTKFPDINDGVEFKKGLTIGGSQSIAVQDDSGKQNLVEMNVTNGPTSGVEESYSFAIGGIEMFKMYSEADGSGGIQNEDVRSLVPLNTNGNNLIDGMTTIWDSQTSSVPQSSLGGPASSLSSYPLNNSDISNSSVTVTAGNQLSGGGTISLGQSLTVSLEDIVSVDTVNTSGAIGTAVYQSKSDIPTKHADNGNIVMTQSDGLVVYNT